MTKARLSISSDQAVELAELFRLMGDATRLRIVVACLAQPRCVSDIATETGLPPPLVSYHLRLLRGTRMVRSERKGKQIFYIAADDRVRCIIVDMMDHIADLEKEDG